MRYLLFPILFLSFYSCGQPLASWEDEKIDVKKGNDLSTIISAKNIFSEGWSDLAQPLFWKQIMILSPDSCLINIASTRQIVARMSIDKWNLQTEAQKTIYRDSIRKAFQLAETEGIYVTTGKSDFYKFDLVYPSLSKGIDAFERNGVDPWYAQAILLIESPGQLKKSKAGAYGPFQLMPGVARLQGLTVTKTTDERSDFERSAYAASRLLKTVCIPEAKKMLTDFNITFKEKDLWFRLFVLHIYHAGAMNVRAVLNKINPEIGSQEIITKMWQTKAGDFGNNSQNYTQLALASQLILHDIIHNECDGVYDCLVQN